jgi:Mlc titration factor MtfA (ptsG expression regulator)
MPVAGRVEIAAHLAERKLEIVERAGLAFHHDAAVEDAAAMLQAALERDLVGLDDLHCFLLRPDPVRTRQETRQDKSVRTDYLGGALLAAP